MLPAVRYFHSSIFNFNNQQPPNNQYSWRNPDAIPSGETLLQNGIDLTEQARKGKLDPVIGRDTEIDRTLEVLCRRTKNNPALIGEAGVGKTSIVEGIAQRIVNGEVPEAMKNKRIISLDVSSIIADTGIRGSFEKKLQKILKDVKDTNGNTILFIDEIHLIVGAGQTGEGGSDIANIMKPYLARGEISCIGATTLDEYRNVYKYNAALARRFQPIVIQEPNVLNTINILRALRERYELHHGIHISDSALITAAKYADRYLTDRKMPDKAIDLVDEAASHLRLHQESKPAPVAKLEDRIASLKMEIEAVKKDDDNEKRMKGLKDELKKDEEEYKKLVDTWKAQKKAINDFKESNIKLEEKHRELDHLLAQGKFEEASEMKYKIIPELEVQVDTKLNSIDKGLLRDKLTSDDICDVVARRTGIPVSSLKEDEKTNLLKLEPTLSKQVIGQPEAIHRVSEALRISRAGLRPHDRPLGVFMFLGPTGVGKTELCKAISRYLFKSDAAMTRIDMSEYMERFSISRLIGPPPGYIYREYIFIIHYIGYEEGGTLTETVRRRPYQIILLDELEKAHKDVYNLLLQVFDEGRLTDSHGRTVDFRNTLMIMTSNLGSQFYTNPNLTSDDIKQQVLKNAHDYFSPEFINRVDDLLVFNSLTRKSMNGIVNLQLEKVKSLLNDQNIRYKITDNAIDWLADKGFDPRYGARPIKRTVENYVLSPLASDILAGRVLPGNTVKIDCEPKIPVDKLLFEVDHIKKDLMKKD
ncbi:hypothetical protein WA158_005271 [Blastocystis sp. Blastoise]